MLQRKSLGKVLSYTEGRESKRVGAISIFTRLFGIAFQAVCTALVNSNLFQYN